MDLRFWGKERGLDVPYPLVCHGLDTAAAVRVLWRVYVSDGLRVRLAEALGLSESEACAVLEFWAGLHDLGKIVPGFQRQVEIPSGYSDDQTSVRHERASGLCVPHGLEALGYGDDDRRRWSLLVGQVLGGHHGEFERVKPMELRPQHFEFHGLGNGEWQAQRNEVMTALAEVLAAPVPVTRGNRSAAVLATGLVILADWLASQADFIRRRLGAVPVHGDAAQLREFFDGSVREIENWVAGAGLSRLRLSSDSFEEEFPDFRPNILQKSIAEKLPKAVTGPGLLLIAAPTGFGKTETSFHAARLMAEVTGTAGLFVALPTMATSDQMFGRVARYLARRSEDSSSVSLAHGMAWLRPVEEMLAAAVESEGISSDRDNRVHSSEWLRGAKRPLLAGAGVGTIDQLLLSVLPVRHNSVRMFALAGKTVVIDEVHAFDPYMRRLLVTLLRWLGEYRVPVVLMSATLPGHVARDLAAAYLGTKAKAEIAVPYPGWVYAERGREPVVTEVRFPAEQQRTLDMQLAEVELGETGTADRMPVLKRELAPLAEDGGCAVVICTTVPEAQDTYLALKEWSGERDVELVLLHARFPVHQREKITKDVIAALGKPGDADARECRRRRRMVLVSTSLIEQSLDIDADLVLSDLAPIELLLQRAGRLQRHQVCDVLRPRWAKPGPGSRRRMVVLSAPRGDPRRILRLRSWTAIYEAAHLIRAHRLLVEHQESGIAIPDDVQELVDQGNPGELPMLDDRLLEGFSEEELKRAAKDMVQRQTAEFTAIPAPPLRNLAELSEHAIDEQRARTRFNADSEQALPLFETPDGVLRLGSPTGQPLPAMSKGRLTREQAREVMQHIVPLSGSLVRGHDERHRLPDPWGSTWPLKELIALRQRVDAASTVHPATVGDRSLLLDAELGLRRVD